MKTKQPHIIDKVGVTLALGNIIGRHNVFIWNGTSKSAPSRFILNGKTLTASMQSHWLTPNIYDDIKIIEDEMADVIKEYPQCNIAKICEQVHVYQKISLIVAQLDKSLPLIGGGLYSLNGKVIRLTDEHEIYSVDGKPRVLRRICAVVDIKIMFRVEGEMFSVNFNRADDTCFLSYKTRSLPEEILIMPRYIFSNLDIDHFITNVIGAVNTQLCRYPTISEL